MKAVFCNQCHREWLETFHPGLLSEADLNREPIASGIYFIPGHYHVCSHRVTEKQPLMRARSTACFTKLVRKRRRCNMARHKLTAAEQVKGIKKALANPKTPKQFKPGMRKRLKNLQK